MSKPIKPGTDNQPAGTYHETGKDGRKLKTGRTIHIDSGDRLPPTQLEKIISKCSCVLHSCIFLLLKQIAQPNRFN